MAFPNWKGSSEIDSQTLSFDSATNALSISNGNTVNLNTASGNYDTLNAKDIFVFDQPTGLVATGHIYAPGPGGLVRVEGQTGGDVVELRSGQQQIDVGTGVIQLYTLNGPPGSENFLQVNENAFGNTEIVRFGNNTIATSTLEFDQTDVIVRGRELVRGAAQTLGGLQLNPTSIAITDATATNTIELNLTGTDFQFVPNNAPSKTMVLNQDGDLSVEGDLTAQGDISGAGSLTIATTINAGGNITTSATVEGSGIVATNTALCGDFYGEVNINRANSFLRAIPSANDTVAFTTSASPSGWLELNVPSVPDNAGMIRVEFTFVWNYGYTPPFFSPSWATYQAGDSVNPARGAKNTIFYTNANLVSASQNGEPMSVCWTFIRNLDWVGNQFQLTVLSGAQIASGAIGVTQTFDVATVF